MQAVNAGSVSVSSGMSMVSSSSGSRPPPDDPLADSSSGSGSASVSSDVYGVIVLGIEATARRSLVCLVFGVWLGFWLMSVATSRPAFGGSAGAPRCCGCTRRIR